MEGILHLMHLKRCRICFINDGQFVHNCLSSCSSVAETCSLLTRLPFTSLHKLRKVFAGPEAMIRIPQVAIWLGKLQRPHQILVCVERSAHVCLISGFGMLAFPPDTALYAQELAASCPLALS